jgi:UDP-N-acetylmuramate dehydrogenase
MHVQLLEDYARNLGCTVEKEAPMSAYTSFKIGGPAELYVTAPTGKTAQQVLCRCREQKIPTLFLGNGSNILVSDEGIRGVVLRMDGRDAHPDLPEEGQIVCPAGVSLKRLCLFARDNALTGLEFAYGIPGTVGGAVYMNAGAYGGQMADVLVSAEVITPSGEWQSVSAENMKLGYRNSALMINMDVVVSASFRLHPDSPEAISRRMDDFMQRRKNKQPLEYPSAGSFFKRPEGHFAGALIEQSGLKGFTVGGAQVSEKHAGFVINRGGATCADVHRLAEAVQERVWTNYGVRLEPEVRYIG